jgi:hypothetical protein
MGLSSQGIQEQRKTPVYIILVCQIDDCRSAHFPQQCRCIARVTGEREDRLLQAQVFVCLSWDLMIAIGSLK